MDEKRVTAARGIGILGKDGTGRSQDMAPSEVYAYWEALRQDGAVPLRDAIDPRGIAGALEKVFMIERIAPGLARFRLVGSQITELFGCEVRGMPFSALFDPIGREKTCKLLDALFDEPAILRMSLEAERGIGRPALGAQLLLLPLASQPGRIDLALGCLSLDGATGRAPRRFAVARSMVARISGRPDKIIAPQTEFAEPAAIFALPRPPRASGHLKLVHSVD